MITTTFDRTPYAEIIKATKAAKPRKLRIVVVEDDPGCSVAFEMMLEQYYSVKMFSTAEAALLYLEDHWQEVDLLFLDRKLPGESGLSLLTMIRKDNRLCKMPVVLQTASAYNEFIDEAGSLVDIVDSYLQKPFNKSQALRAISKVLDAQCRHLGTA